MRVGREDKSQLSKHHFKLPEKETQVKSIAVAQWLNTCLEYSQP